MMDVHPVTLEGSRVRLIPLALDQLDRIWHAAADPTIWRFTGGRTETRDEMRAAIEKAIALPDCLPFSTVVKATNEIVGGTRFGSISPAHERAEIGWTWLTPKWQRTFVNTEAKLLMLAHAFEVWDCQRVEFKTHIENKASRDAIVRLGATCEGTLRNHMIQPDGSSRDTVYYSIIDHEWPSVREQLQARLDSHGPTPRDPNGT